MHMPDAIPENMFAPCGMNCMVCYKHCTVCKSVRPCAGCLNGDEGKPRHCRACAIRDCCREKGLRYCLECTAFPCRRLNRLEKSYRTRYNASLLSNSRAVLTRGLAVFLENERQKYTCSVCGGIAHPRPRWNRSMRCAVPVAEKGTFPLRDFCAILFLWLQAYRRTKVPGRPADAARSAQPPQE